ncbi:hypothetical protein [Paenibacillus sp. MDMC362]|uniref:hypothetical protein n=1 Tax=Paenibacillus sp. MDMC362 TaxID=2977365 RepID=UPI000DC40587|nr:hypothetical protein [Paenibacillus sp. MDMC362]RAR45564.1 hypothetical protein DP091_04560 [Paenibacillus sp. MDMC362]
MSYLMMHTTHPLICIRQTDYPAHGFVVADSMWGWEPFQCHPSDSMSSETCSFDMAANSTPNRLQNSEYDTGHDVSVEAEMFANGVVMTLKKAQ